MLDIKNYVRVQSLQEAYDLCQNRRNVIIGGMLWLKMQNRSVDTAIDLCDLGLNQIEDKGDEIHIGAMVTLRQLELDPLLNEYTHHALKESVKHIVGVQFRNLATIGGSLFGRYGFSDVLTMFLALDAYVELYHGGIVSIREFVEMRPSLDILVRIIVKKTPMQVVYLSQRNTQTDFPILTCAISKMNQDYYCVIGARPLKATLLLDEKHLLDSSLSDESILAFADDIAQRVTLGSNLRGSADYRRHLTKVLIKRALWQLREEHNHGN